MLIAEHFGALLVFTAAVGWLATMSAYYQQAVVPIQTQASAYYLANVALTTGASAFTLGADRWQVTISQTKIEVFKNAATTPVLAIRHDVD